MTLTGKAFLAISMMALLSHGAMAQSVDADEVALKQLEAFLFSASQRADYANGRPDAKAANDYLNAFPPWAQQELLSITMDIMRAKKEKAMDNVNTYRTGGGQAAMSSFSPAVQQRLRALAERLGKDPQFSNPQNMKRMQGMMPSP